MGLTGWQRHAKHSFLRYFKRGKKTLLIVLYPLLMPKCSISLSEHRSLDSGREVLLDEVLRNSYEEMDNELRRQLKQAFAEVPDTCCFQPPPPSKYGGAGSTSVTVVVTSSDVYVAHAGDSKALVLRDGEPAYLTNEHRLTDKSERERIEKSQICRIVEDGIRLNKRAWTLGITRGLGDFAFKTEKTSVGEQPVTFMPDVRVLERHASQLILLGSDGFWDCVDAEEVCSLVWEQVVTEGVALEDVVEKLRLLALEDQPGFDNITLVLVKLN